MQKVVPDSPVSILMPIRNEIDTIPSVFVEWRDTVLNFLPQGSELVFDDGFSSDGTYEFLQSLTKEYPFVRVLRGDAPDGFAGAARRLYRDARNEWIFFTDSDGQYPADEFWRITEHCRDVDFIHGAKCGRQDPAYRLIASFFYNSIAKLLFGTKYADINSAFRLMRKEIVNTYVPQVRHVPLLLNSELLLRAEAAGIPIIDVKISHRARQFGNSRGIPPKTFIKECWKALKGMFALRSELRSQRSLRT